MSIDFFLLHVAFFGLFISLTGILLIFYDFWFCDFLMGFGVFVCVCALAVLVSSLCFVFLNFCLCSKKRGLSEWGCGEDLGCDGEGKTMIRI